MSRHEKDYFGGIFPPGRYECRLTATDAKGKRKVLRKWMVLETKASLLASAKAKKSARPSRKKRKKTSGRRSNRTKTAKKRLKPLRLSRPTGTSGASGARLPPGSPKGGKTVRVPKTEGAGPSLTDGKSKLGAEQAGQTSAGVPYYIPFTENTLDITREGQRQLDSILLAAYQDYPLHNLEVEGYAHGGETDAARLAEERARFVFSFLTGGRNGQNKIRMERVSMKHKVVADTRLTRVRVYFQQRAKQ